MGTHASDAGNRKSCSGWQAGEAAGLAAINAAAHNTAMGAAAVRKQECYTT